MTQTPAPARTASPAPATLDAIAAAILDSKSPNTRRAYESAWAAWSGWCAQNGHQALPGSPDGLALYLAERQAKGAGMATLRMACCAIAAAHDAGGHPPPTAHPGIRAALAGWARQAARAGKGVRQAKALDAEAVAAIRGHLGQKARTDRRAALSIALCSVMADAGLRRSEAAALEWDDVRSEPDGSGRLTVRHSKTEQGGRRRRGGRHPRRHARPQRPLQARAAPCRQSGRPRVPRARGDSPDFSSFWGGGEWVPPRSRG